MKLLQINDTDIVNINDIQMVKDSGDNFCWIKLKGMETFMKCTIYSVQEITDFVNNYHADTDESYYDYIVDKLNHILWRIIKNGNNGICKEDK